MSDKDEITVVEENKALTIFEAVETEQIQKAIKSLITGVTPQEAIHQRPGPGGEMLDYINTYYSIRQIGLLTGFRWSSECLEERGMPDAQSLIATFKTKDTWDTDKIVEILQRAFVANPREVGAHMKVRIYDKQGNEYSHTSWGQKDVSRYKSGAKTNHIISLFDDFKAATSDGIKKALSYFGIGADVYGMKDNEFDDRQDK